MRKVKLIILVFIAIYLVICAALFWGQRKLIYIPPLNYVPPKALELTGIQEVEFTGPDYKAASWYAPPRINEAPVIMFFHGNGSAVYSDAHIFKDLMAEGYGVLSVSYPGYPYIHQSAETRRFRPAQSNIIQAARQNYDFLRGQNIKPEQIVFMGTSLGAAVAAQLAAETSPRLLILDAPFNSMLDMAQMRVAFVPNAFLLRDKYLSDEALQNYDGPMIWLHGTQDRIIPITQGQKLYDGYQGPKTAHIFEGGRHTNLWQIGGRDIVLTRLSDMFLRAAVTSSSKSSED